MWTPYCGLHILNHALLSQERFLLEISPDSNLNLAIIRYIFFEYTFSVFSSFKAYSRLGIRERIIRNDSLISYRADHPNKIASLATDGSYVIHTMYCLNLQKRDQTGKALANETVRNLANDRQYAKCQICQFNPTNYTNRQEYQFAIFVNTKSGLIKFASSKTFLSL